MSQASFDCFVRVLRCVYMGRSEFASTLLNDLPQEEREDWYRLADTFRALIGDSGCLEWSKAHDHSSVRPQSGSVPARSNSVGD